MIHINFDDNKVLPELFGESNKNLNYIESKLQISLSSRGNILAIAGDDNKIILAKSLFLELYKILENRGNISFLEIDAIIKDQNLGQDLLHIKTNKKTITPKNQNQIEYLKLLDEKDIVFAFGPAGTGKTYFVVAKAISMFLAKKIDKIILSRPAIEAGEKLGFLPGDLKDKVDPYIRPLYDAIGDMLTSEQFARCLETKQIEIAPLAFMRGRTLSNAFIILDEAQNATINQMKMFLTRLGYGSKMVINGDPSQIDLPVSTSSGLANALEKLGSIEEIGFVEFNEQDVVRHFLVSKIVKAYRKS